VCARNFGIFQEACQRRPGEADDIGEVVRNLNQRSSDSPFQRFWFRGQGTEPTIAPGPGDRNTEAMAKKNTKSIRFPSVGIRTCSVSCTDLGGCEHSVEVSADSLYEAVAKARGSSAKTTGSMRWGEVKRRFRLLLETRWLSIKFAFKTSAESQRSHTR
jgi:hypothetical protein